MTNYPCRAGVAFVFAASLLLISSAAAAQLREPRFEGRLDAATRALVESQIDSARTLGLPLEPMIDKALEGASKHASGARIAQAVRILRSELALARGAVGASASAADVAAAAGALHAGASPADLVRLRRARQGQPLTVALSVLSDLVARGVPADTATSAVLALVDAHARDDELVAYRRTVERDIALGAPPAVAASVRFGLTDRMRAASNSDFNTQTGTLRAGRRPRP